MARFTYDFIGLAAGVRAFAAVTATGIGSTGEEAQTAIAIAKTAVTEDFEFDHIAWHGGADAFDFLGG